MDIVPVPMDLDANPAPFPRRAAARQLQRAAQYVRTGYTVARSLANAYGRHTRKRQNSATTGDRKDNKKVSKTGGAASTNPSSGNGPKVMKYKKKAKTAKASLKTRIKKLEKTLKKQNWHHHVYKDTATFQVSCSTNLCGYNEGLLWRVANIELMLNSLPYTNVAAPGTNATFDATTIVPNTKWAIQCYAKAVMRNNYLFPIKVNCYICKPKVQTGTAPSAVVLTGITKIANPSISNNDQVDLFPSDSPDFHLLYKIIRSCSHELKTGDECIVPYSELIKYDQEYQDLNTSNYNPPYSRFIMVRIQGVVCHDSTTDTNIGYASGKLDVVIHRTFKLKKSSEAPQRTIEQLNGLSAITTPVVGVATAEKENALA